MFCLMKKLYTNLFNLLIVMFFLNVTGTYAQTLNKPNPTFGGFVCADTDFNNFNVDFSWQTPLVASDNVFILELSDENGDFTTPTELTTVSNSNTTLNFTFNFSFPTNTAGSAYRVRVRSTNPVRTSPVSDAFAAYYVNADEPLIINDFSDIILCGGGSAIINVDNFPDEVAYIWRRNNVIIPGETGPSIIINQTGSYYAEVDYGEFCSTNTASNIIEVLDGDSGTTETVTITSSGNIDCETGESVTITSNITNTDYEYTWYRNGNPVSGETSSTIEVSQGGTYFLEIQVGDCPIFSNDLVISGGAAGEITIDPGEDITISAGESVTVTASGGDSYEWFSPSDELISSSASVIIDAAGVYTLIATSDSCEITRTVTVTGPGNPGPSDIIPNVLTPNGDGINDTWQIPDEYLNANTEVIIYGPTGEILHQVTAYANDWPQSALTYIVNNPVFYYRILEGSNVLEQGSITLIK